MTDKNWPLYEVFLRARNGLSHKHVGSLHAIDDEMALQTPVTSTPAGARR